MSEVQFRVDATNPTFSGGASGTRQQATVYRNPIIQQDDNDLALVPRSPVAVQTLQGAGVGDTVASAQSNVVFVSEQETVRESTLTDLSVSAGPAGPGIASTHAKSEVVKIQDRVKKRIEVKEMPDGSIEIHHITEAERRVYTQIFERLYLSATDLPEDAADKEPTCADRCIDQCCQACTCEFGRLIRCRRQQGFIHKNEIMTPTLRRGRQKGWGMLFQFTFPLVTSVPRLFWVITEFIFTFIAWVLSIAMFTLGNDAAFNIIHLVLASIAFALATLDFVFNMCDVCKKYCCIVHCCKHRNCTGFGKCLRCCKNVVDFCRTWIAELILYPLLVCDMFEFITGQGWKNETATDRLGFALFIVSSGALVVYVYIVRLLILFGMIYHVQKRPKPEKLSDEDQTVDDRARIIHDQTYSTSAFWFQLYFFIHVFGQMLVQILMLISIGAKIQYDNPPPTTVNTAGAGADGTSIHISPFLWYMIVAGYILPFLGFLTFFIVTYFWVQEFPIGICLDVLSLLIPTTGSADTIHKVKQEIKIPFEKLSRIKHYVHDAELREDFSHMRDVSWFQKFAHPFRSPVMVVLCILYFASHIAFAYCAVLTDDVELNEFGFERAKMVVLNGGNWYKFYTAYIILGILANLYTFTVAFAWLILINLFIILFFCYCYYDLCECGKH